MKTCQDPQIVFFGTSEFGAIILGKLIHAGMVPVLVVTTPDKPVGRKQELTSPPVKVLANRLGLPVMQPEKLDQDTRYKIQDTSPDLFVVASYGKILPGELLNVPKKGSLNVHPSLLPRYRGPSPVQHALLNGDAETGVTIMLLDEKMDHGPIVASSNFKIQNPKIAYPELHNALAELGAELLVKTIPQWIGGKIRAQAQDESQATYTVILQKEDGRIDWNNPAEYIERQVRALQPWPGTYTKCQMPNDKFQKTLKILKASVLPGTLPKPGLGKVTPGTVFLTADKKLAIQCGEDALVIEELQLEGKKPLSSKDFLLGYKNFLGIVLSQA